MLIGGRVVITILPREYSTETMYSKKNALIAVRVLFQKYFFRSEVKKILEFFVVKDPFLVCCKFSLDIQQSVGSDLN